MKISVILCLILVAVFFSCGKKVEVANPPPPIVDDGGAPPIDPTPAPTPVPRVICGQDFTVGFSWTANPADGNTDGYNIHYGHAGSRNYDMTVDVETTSTPLAPYAEISTQFDDDTYYFACTAYNDTSGEESGYSNEVSILFECVDGYIDATSSSSNSVIIIPKIR